MEPSSLITARGWILCFLVFAFAYCLSTTGFAQSFYPDDIGNQWGLRSIDGMNLRTVTIRGPEIINGEELRLIEENTNGNINQLFVRSEADAIKLFRSVVSIAILGEITFDYSPPQVFLPVPANLGSTWTVQSETEIVVVGKVRTTNLGEVVAIEEIITPAGTFQNCLKIEQKITLNLAIADLVLNNAMWLAPDTGIVKATDTSGIIFELVSFDIAEREPQTAVHLSGNLATSWATMKDE